MNADKFNIAVMVIFTGLDHPKHIVLHQCKALKFADNISTASWQYIIEIHPSLVSILSVAPIVSTKSRFFLLIFSALKASIRCFISVAVRWLAMCVPGITRFAHLV
jgi:hypothetical protein